MITLIERTIENISFRLIVDETIGNNKTLGQPMLKVKETYCNMIYGVDTLQIIKAIATATSLIEFKHAVKGTWSEEAVHETINILIRGDSK